MTEALQHATCVAIKGRGVLLLGRPGSGKSSLGFRLIDRGAMLVADDYVILRREEESLTAVTPPQIAGLMEVRAVGIVQLPYLRHVPVVLAVMLGKEGERLPHPKEGEFLGFKIPLITLDALRDDAPLKVEIALSGSSIQL